MYHQYELCSTMVIDNVFALPDDAHVVRIEPVVNPPLGVHTAWTLWFYVPRPGSPLSSHPSEMFRDSTDAIGYQGAARIEDAGF